MSTFGKHELLEKVLSQKLSDGLITQKDLNTVFDAIIETIMDCGKTGTDITLQGFGAFKRTISKAKKARNPKTGETIDVPEKANYKFRISHSFKTEINKK
jgi:nucleoid DNA-binding protein